jgi:hypothetical protein
VEDGYDNLAWVGSDVHSADQTCSPGPFGTFALSRFVFSFTNGLFPRQPDGFIVFSDIAMPGPVVRRSPVRESNITVCRPD